MAHDYEASGSSRSHDEEAPGVQEPGVGGAVAKAVYDRDMAEVERECSALYVERVEAAEGHEVELALREAVATVWEEAATQREGVLRTAEGRVGESYKDVCRCEEQLAL
ncbi:hypothetical protein E2562_022135 [Oryza meyeriana var. granulata]|uniref:Uncharacterized protein n=1 Tax=Oryza meyeriana var. granulata TaxID=110450 RepID=A0A6G1BMU0_9ORYZ|nr:hypothetical protein E2562_022135 [Oryza meyeriana var. granulata]